MADLDGDGVDDALESSGRTAMMVAMQVGEKFGRLREELARDAARRDDAESKALGVRFEAERGAARAELRVVEQPEWWDRATPQDIARVIETAETWKGQDDAAKRAAERIETEVRDRYGVDVNDFRSSAASERGRADREVTDAALLIAEADRLDRDAQRGTEPDAENKSLATELEQRADEYERRAEEGGDGTNSPEELRELASDARSQAQLYRDMDANEQPRQADAPATTAEAQANRAEAATVYDSSERRRDKASQMETAGVDASDVRTRMRADVDQGRPAAEAVAAGTGAGRRAPAGVQARGARRTDRGR